MALEILLETALVPPITRLSEIPINLCHFKAQMKTSDEPKISVDIVVQFDKNKGLH